jgi:hypothetical protein
LQEKELDAVASDEWKAIIVIHKGESARELV